MNMIFRNKIGNKKNNSRSKKGQITIFVIAGILIIFLVALVFYLRASAARVRPPVEQLEVVDEIKPIQAYVTDCLSSVSKDALTQLGNNGGYINIQNMKISPIPYKSDVLVFEPQKIPYWYYLKKDCNDPTKPYGCLQTKRPPMCRTGVQCVIQSNGDNSIEQQLNKFVEDNLASCINNFDVFQDRFEINAGNMKVESVVRDESVSFKLDYPLSVKVKGTSKSTNIPYFYVEQNVKLKELYSLASEIYDAEMQYHFLETNTLNLISVYSGIDQNLLPPTSGIEIFVAGKKYWIRSNVKDMLMSDILPYVSMLQIANAGNAKEILSTATDPKYLPFQDGLYRSMMIKVSNNSYFDINANIIYPYSDIYLRIGDSEIIKPESLNAQDNIVMKMVGFFLNEYNFKYDISYPVIVRLEDPNAFNGEGYTFNFAMESNIRQNVPVSGNITVISVGGQKEIDLNSELQQVNRTITIKTYDRHTGDALDGVIISYKCGNQYVIGQTAINNNVATLQSRFPYCASGGEILFEKPGYMGSSILYNNNEGNDAQEFRFDLWPIVQKNIRIMKRTPTNIETIRRQGSKAIFFYNIQASNITSNETVMLSVAREKEDSGDSDIPQSGFLAYKNAQDTITELNTVEQKAQITQLFSQGKISAATRDSLLADLASAPVQQTVPATLEADVKAFLKANPEPDDTLVYSWAADKKYPLYMVDNMISTLNNHFDYKMDFVPGKYYIDAFMIFNGKITIPKDTKKICPVPKILGICIAGEKTITLDEQNFDSWVDGGAKIDFTLTENDIYSDSDTLTLYVLEIPLPTNWDMLQNYQSIEQYQSGKTFLVKPRLD